MIGRPPFVVHRFSAAFGLHYLWHFIANACFQSSELPSPEDYQRPSISRRNRSIAEANSMGRPQNRASRARLRELAAKRFLRRFASRPGATISKRPRLPAYLASTARHRPIWYSPWIYIASLFSSFCRHGEFWRWLLRRWLPLRLVLFR